MHFHSADNIRNKSPVELYSVKYILGSSRHGKKVLREQFNPDNHNQNAPYQNISHDIECLQKNVK